MTRSAMPPTLSCVPRLDCGHDVHGIATEEVGLLATLAPLERVDAVGIDTAALAAGLESQRSTGRDRRSLVRPQCRRISTTSRRLRLRDSGGSRRGEVAGG